MSEVVIDSSLRWVLMYTDLNCSVEVEVEVEAETDTMMVIVEFAIVRIFVSMNKR